MADQLLEKAGAVENERIKWPRFEDIAEPRMICFGVGNGSGSKLFQAYLDGHPEIYMTPAYQLMYLYPHWFQWKEEQARSWSWQSIIDSFCENHASLLDSRRFPGNDGLDALGDNHDQYLHVDENIFRDCLLHLLDGRAISSRTFLLAVHYAYALIRGDDLKIKKVLVYHLHVHEYVRHLLADFPDMKVLGFVRDPRANLKGRFQSNVHIDEEKLNGSDVAFFLRRTFLNHWQFHIDSLERLSAVAPEDMRVVRHEDINLRREELLRATAEFLGISYHETLTTITFGGLKWWGAAHYGMKPMNKPNPKTLSDKWKSELSALDWFILEGLGYRYCKKYGYQLFRYKTDGVFSRCLLFLALLWPMKYERWILGRYLSPKYFQAFLTATRNEATGETALKDYQLNAFYRHKWCNQGLGLHITPWYRRHLKTGNISEEIGGLGVKGYTYIAASILRYMGAILGFPLFILRRIAISQTHFYRVIRHRDILPDKL